MPQQDELFEEAYAALRRLAETVYHGTAGRFVLFLGDGKKAVDSLVPTAASRETKLDAAPDSTSRLGATQRLILRAVAGLDAENPTGEEIAEAAGLPYESHLKKMLAALRQEKLLSGKKGEAGYPITPAGLAALDIEDNSDS